MARIRTVKPEFFRHRKLFLAERGSGFPLRLAFEGLWTCADREGRFRWEPEELKLDCLPYDDLDFGAVMDALAKFGFVEKYEVDGKLYGCIPAWNKHQHINNREAPSSLPAPNAERSADQNGTGYVYIAAAWNAGMAKVGFSRNHPAGRLHDLSCGSPEPLFLVGYFEGSPSDETSLRSTLKTDGARREWVSFSLDVWDQIDAWVTDKGRVRHAWSTRQSLVQGEGKGREVEGNGRGGTRDDTRPSPELFSKFKSGYPTRGGSNPWKPAEDLFWNAIRDGAEPTKIIGAAEAYAGECSRQKIVGTEKVAQAQTWLTEERWRDYAAPDPADLEAIEIDMRRRGYEWTSGRWAKCEAVA